MLVLLAGTGVLAAMLVAAVLASGEDGGSGRRRTLSSSGAGGVQLVRFDGGAVTLAELQGRSMIVNFFASWCGPCAREMPGFEEVHRQRGSEVLFVGVSIQDEPGAALDLVERTGVSYDVVRDMEGSLFRSFGAVSMPTTVFITARGEISEVRGGELSRGALHAHIDRLLQQG